MIPWPPFGPKLAPWRSRAWLDLARGQSCVRCGSQDGTVVAAHYSGLYAGELGGGKSVKVGDAFTADLCHECHTAMDRYSHYNGEARALEFMRCILRTQMRRLAMMEWRKAA